MTYSAAAGPSAWAWWAMAVFVLLFAAVSVGAYLHLSRGAERPRRHASAERRLRAQLARGQITEEEYLHLTAALASRNTRYPPRSGPPRS